MLRSADLMRLKSSLDHVCRSARAYQRKAVRTQRSSVKLSGFISPESVCRKQRSPRKGALRRNKLHRHETQLDHMAAVTRGIPPEYIRCVRKGHQELRILRSCGFKIDHQLQGVRMLNVAATEFSLRSYLSDRGGRSTAS